jgi:DNA adenine methylase
MTAVINPPLKWHGGKHYLASKIIDLMPPHIHYVEPYFGGGAVMLAKNPEGVSEVANDLNKRLTNFWLVLSSPDGFAEFHRRMEAVPFSQHEYQDADRKMEMCDSVGQAIGFFIKCRQSMSGRMDNFAPLSRTRTRRGMNEQASAWMNAVDGLPAVHARLRRVAILNQPAVDVIRKQDGEQTLFYLDPPYLHETRSTTGEYEHEMTREQHEELLRTIAVIRGSFILSGYDSELYRIYERNCGWSRREFDLPNNSASGEKKERKKEIVWMNFEPK